MSQSAAAAARVRASDLCLLPAPKLVVPGDDVLDLRRGARVLIPAPVDRTTRIAAARLVRAAGAAGAPEWTVHAGDPGTTAYRQSRVPVIACVVRAGAGLEPSEHRIVVGAAGVQVTGADLEALCHGLVTLTQVVRQTGPVLPHLRIEDRPTIGRRGVMLDQSRDRVATLETVKRVAEDMAVLKLNELQLYSEHTFAYVDREVVWGGDDPFTAEEILELDEFCRDRHIDLVPNMNSLGHLHKWLEHPEYAPLAENHPYRSYPEVERITVTGERAPLWGQVPFSLCATDPASAEFVDGLLDELLPHFTSRFLNANLDEPFDLGLGRSRTEVEQRGRAWVYLDYLKAQNERVRQRGLTMLFGADVTWSDPEIIDHLPKDAIVMDWGYCERFPYAEHARGFADAGQPFYILTGTDAWETIVGATDDVVHHHRAAAAAAAEYGGLGLVVTDWGHYDHGSTQQFVISYPGIAAAAAEGWSPGASSVEDLAAGLSLHVFDDPAEIIGRLLFDLGSLSSVVGLSITDIGGVLATVRSPAFWALRGTLAETRHGLGLVGTTADQLDEVLGRLEELADRPRASACRREDADHLVAELEFTVALMRHACRRCLLSLETDPTAAAPLADELRREVPGLLTEFSTRWLVRYRAANLWRTVERLARIGHDHDE